MELLKSTASVITQFFVVLIAKVKSYLNYWFKFFEIIKKPDPVKAKVLELIQCWSHAFKKNPNYKIVEDFYNAMKLEGIVYNNNNNKKKIPVCIRISMWIHFC